LRGWGLVPVLLASFASQCAIPDKSGCRKEKSECIDGGRSVDSCDLEYEACMD
jgi:hypothetical protein